MDYYALGSGFPHLTATRDSVAEERRTMEKESKNSHREMENIREKSVLRNG